MDLTYKLTDWILFDFRHDTDLQFSRLNMEFATYQPKDGPIATKRKSKHILGNIDWTQWPLSLTLAMTLKGEV